jgi:hypothetical protein
MPPPETGLKSTSFKLWAGTSLGGIVSAVQAAVTKGSFTHTLVYGIGGIVAVVVSTAAKTWHDKGLHESYMQLAIATVRSGDAQVVAQLPALRVDLDKAVPMLETQFPALASLVDALKGRIEALEKAPTVVETQFPALSSLVESLEGRIEALEKAPSFADLSKLADQVSAVLLGKLTSRDPAPVPEYIPPMDQPRLTT